jgi:hypothetical protein
MIFNAVRAAEERAIGPAEDWQTRSNDDWSTPYALTMGETLNGRPSVRLTSTAATGEAIVLDIPEQIDELNGHWRKTAPRLGFQEHLGIINSRERVCGQFILPVSLVHFIQIIIAPVRQDRRWSSRQTAYRFQAGSPTNVRRREPRGRAEVGIIERQMPSLPSRERSDDG